MWIGYGFCLLRTIVQTSSSAEDRLFTNKKLGIILLYLKKALYLQKKSRLWRDFFIRQGRIGQNLNTL